MLFRISGKNLDNDMSYVTYKILFAKHAETMGLIVSTESADYGPVFIQEPDDLIFPTDSEEKKVSLNCQARGNPAPTYRYNM